MPRVRQEEAAPPIGAGSAVIFKGSGFYETDYRSDSYKTASKADKEAAPAKPADTNGKTGAARNPDGRPRREKH